MNGPDKPQIVPRVPTPTDGEIFEKFRSSQQQPGTRLEWQSIDNPDTWDLNMLNDHIRDTILSCGWRRDSIEYRYNNHGFRSDDDYDIDCPPEGDMFLGCSWTDGIGLNIEDTWGYMVSRLRGGVFYNLAQFGTGFDSQYRLLRAWAPVLRPRAIFTLGAMENRVEVYKTGHDRPKVLGSWSLDDPENGDIYLAHTLDARGDLLNRMRSFDAIRFVAMDLGIPLYIPGNDLVEEADWECFTRGSIARDGMHPGKIFHQHMVDNLGRWQRI